VTSDFLEWEAELPKDGGLSKSGFFVCAQFGEIRKGEYDV
jgi:hypothetical protein